MTHPGPSRTIIVETDRVWFGSIGVRAGLTAGQGKVVPVLSLFSAPWNEFHGDWESSHYATAWAVVHYLFHGEDKSLRHRFFQFCEALGQAGPGGATRAWAGVFPEIAVSELDERVRRHVSVSFDRHVDSRMGFALRHPTQGPLRIEPADPARVEAMRAILRGRRKAEKL